MSTHNCTQYLYENALVLRPMRLDGSLRLRLEKGNVLYVALDDPSDCGFTIKPVAAGNGFAPLHPAESNIWLTTPLASGGTLNQLEKHLHLV